jgi:hypothetical protein
VETLTPSGDDAQKLSQEKNQELISSQEFQILKLAYDKHLSNWRHYDSHIWQIPSLAMAINAFLVGQAFNPELVGANREFRALMIFLSGFFTFVLLIALVKHRLHECAQDKNIAIIESRLGIEGFLSKKFPFNNTQDILVIDPHANFIVRVLGTLKANQWLMYVMLMIVLIDLFLCIGVIFYNL